MRKNILLTLTTCFVLTLAVSGQCTLGIDKAPKVHGASLRMTSDEVITLFGKPFSQDAEYMAYLDSWPDTSTGELKFTKPANFDGVRQLMFSLTDGRVSNIMITYKQIDWTTPEEFANTLSEKLALPKAWTFTGDSARMECQKWAITANSGTNEVYMVDHAPFLKKIRDDEKKAAEKKKVFKP